MKNVIYKQVRVVVWDHNGQCRVSAGVAFFVVLATNLGQR